MADSGIFIGWGEVVHGRERQSVQVFNEAVEMWGRLQAEGTIEDSWGLPRLGRSSTARPILGIWR